MKSIIRKGASLILFIAMVINCFSALPIYAQEDNVNSGETTTEIENSENNIEESFPSEDVTSPEENENNISEKDQTTNDTQIQENDAVEDKEEITTISLAFCGLFCKKNKRANKISLNVFIS